MPNFCRFFFFIVALVFSQPLLGKLSKREAEIRLQEIHQHLNLTYGSFQEEYPEQLMAVMFVSSDDVVLEIGGNIGRNSCVIASILSDSHNLVVVESDPKSAAKLAKNRHRNGLNFQIENGAISNVPLIQSKWRTIPSATLLPGYFLVNTLSYPEFKEKYPADFTLLVADCEGALYEILKGDETLLDDVQTIIVENDYRNRGNFHEVIAKFKNHGFKLVYNQELPAKVPCAKEFYQVWKKT